LEEKRTYLERIQLRLGLTLPPEASSQQKIDTTISELYCLFYPVEMKQVPSELLLHLRPFVPSCPKQNSLEIDVVQELKEQDIRLSPSSHDNWDWIQLQLDCMALDIKPVLDSLESIDDKIEAINWYLFFLKEIRYPPLKEAFQQVDHYSSLGSILSSQRGICLGTTILFTALCQKLGLPITIFTPPGHIFPAVLTSDGFRVVETTARGSNVPLSQYETIDEPTLQPHPLSEIPLSYLQNKAAASLLKKNLEKALELYFQCDKIDKDGPHTKMISLCYLLLGKQKEAIQYAKEALKKEKNEDFVLSDIENSLLSPSSASCLFATIGEENPFLARKTLPSLIQEVEKANESLSLRYHAALILFQEHRAKEAKVLLDNAPKKPTESLHWLLLRISIASFLNESNEELHYATELMKLAIKNKICSADLIESCFSIYRKNPDCQELASLLQKVIHSP
jgi:tetratricopeptide (TPR) repeat protein